MLKLILSNIPTTRGCRHEYQNPGFDPAGFLRATGLEPDSRRLSRAADSAALTTRLALRDLWVEHVFWIRNYALANQAATTQQAKIAADQVVDNATKIANSIAPLYGQPAADQLLKLLAGHWGAVKHYSDATVAKDTQRQTGRRYRLTSNAKAIAAFLATANPNLPEARWSTMLSAHGGHHIAQIDEFAAHDYAGEARTWAMMRSICWRWPTR